ncbi:MAG: Asp23/Gls24 family envelope stress response protein [Lawsonella sp.]|nr:Asp23/Gls24 family envelope stress response protein [Mycobacteriales bacterium]
MSEKEIEKSEIDPTDRGQTIIADVVVSKIAGIAARQVPGVHDLGQGTARMMGAIRERIPGTGADVQQGVAVEVGETEAAIDIVIVAEYGVAIHQLADAIRKNIIDAVEGMTGLSVTEVNINVVDIHLPEQEDEEEESRVH